MADSKGVSSLSLSHRSQFLMLLFPENHAFMSGAICSYFCSKAQKYVMQDKQKA